MIVADKENWICSKCIDIFPFNNISDNRIFQKYAKNTWSIKMPLNCDDLLFDPFDSWSDSNPNILDDYDPDLNYYESSSVRQYSNSDYYDIDQFNDNMKDVAGLSMFHCNIRSATHNSSSLGDYLMSLKHEFDTVCLSETRLHENNKEINDFPNYSQVHKYRENKCGGGVSILIKSSIQFRQIDALALSTDVIECIFVELRMKTSNIIVGCVYRPPSSNLKIFNAELSNILSGLDRRNDVYILGDYNIDLLRHKSHNDTSNFINLMLTSSYIPLINKPTRVTENH